jgi:RNA polymerase sigma-70 factor (ECF subfamily)
MRLVRARLTVGSVVRTDPLSSPGPLIERLYAYIAYRVGDGPEAEDLTSEVLERALRYRKSYDPAKGTPIAWLIGIARRRINARTPTLPGVASEELEASGMEDLEDATVRRLMLAKAIAELDPRARELVALRYGADLTMPQIGKVLRIRTNTAEVRLQRALARLNAAMTPEHGMVSNERM